MNHNPREVKASGETDAGIAKAKHWFELGLIVFVCFGSSIFYSVHPLLTNGELASPSSEPSYYWFLGFKLVGGLMVVAYVFARNLAPVSVPVVSAVFDGGTPLTATLVCKFWLGAVRRIRPSEWALVLAVTLMTPLFHLLTTLGGTFDWFTSAWWRQLSAAHSLVDMGIDLMLLGYVLKRTGRSFQHIGLEWNSRGIVMALPLLLIDRALYAINVPFVTWLGTSLGGTDWRPPDISTQLFGEGVEVLAVAACLVVGFYEELIVRAYLMTVVRRLTNRIWLAIILSVGVQMAYHFYQGVPLAMAHLLVFTVSALFYAATRSILPVALAHSLLDVYSLASFGLRNMDPF